MVIHMFFSYLKFVLNSMALISGNRTTEYLSTTDTNDICQRQK